jgi:cytoplasmic iron level regulating protein YaaA (DUF328/UPF0246 family)
MNLQNNISFSELSNILDNQLINSFTPHVDAIPDVQLKGIYFWFIKQSAYELLSQFVPVTSIEPRYTKTINGEKYDLVYLGTAGVRNNSSGINNGNLFKRLKWHLDLNKSTSSLCSGSMSTYRRTLGALISNDLIDENAQDKLDKFIKKSFIIYYIGYPGTFTQVKDIVNNDESILIKLIRPIFNLDKNPNAINSTNITFQIKERRQFVENNSKKRWCNEKPKNKTKTKNLISKPIKLKNSNSKGLDYRNCVEFQLARNQNIATIANGISNLHVGPCSIELFYENSNDVKLYINNGKRNIRTKNRTISEYFNSPDTKKGNIPKWQIVQNEMNEPNRIIEEITVKVCSNENEKYINSKFELNSKQSKQLKQNKLVNVSIDENSIPANTSSILNKNIYLIPCSSKKIQLEKMENKKFNIEKLEFNNELGKYRKIILKKLNNTKSHKRKKNGITNSIINNLNLNITAQANVLYSEGRLYNSKSSESINWNKNKKEKIYIISALFGIIRADNYIPKYDLAMTDEIDNKKNYAQKFWKGKMDEIIKNLIEDGNTVYNLLSKNYCDIFNSEIISLTKIPKIEYNKSDANGKRGKWLKNNL